MSTIDRLSQLIFNIYEAFTVAFFIRESDHLKCLFVNLIRTQL